MKRLFSPIPLLYAAGVGLFVVSSSNPSTATAVTSNNLRHRRRWNHNHDHGRWQQQSLIRRRTQLDDEDWWPAGSPTYFEMDEGQVAGFVPRPPPSMTAAAVSTTTSSSESTATNNSNNANTSDKKWVVPTLIFSIAAIVTIALAVYICQRRDDLDTDSDLDSSESEYEYRQGHRRRPTRNQYAEALMAIGRNNARNVKNPTTTTSNASVDSRSSWGSWLGGRRRGESTRRDDVNGCVPRQARLGRDNDGGRSSKKRRVDEREIMSVVSDEASEGSDDISLRPAPTKDVANKTVTFLKPALKPESERMSSRRSIPRSRSSEREQTLRKIPREEPRFFRPVPLTRANTDLSQTAATETSTGWCTLPSLLPWFNSDANITTRPLPSQSKDCFGAARKTSRVDEHASQHHSSASGARNKGVTRTVSSNRNSSQKCRDVYGEVLAEKRARELMARLQKQKKLDRYRSSSMTRPGTERPEMRESDDRPRRYRSRSESSIRSARHDIPHRVLAREFRSHDDSLYADSVSSEGTDRDLSPQPPRRYR